MEKIKIELRGIETSEIIEVYSRRAIMELIENLEEKEILRKAWEGFEKGCKHGSAIIDLKTGKLMTDSISNDEEHQEGEYITLYTFDKNFDIGDLELTLYDGETEEEALINSIYYSGQVIDKIELEEQLDYFYNE